MSRLKAMTVPRGVLISVISISAFGTVANTVLIGVSLDKNSKLAQDGQDARLTQCRTFPARLISYEGQLKSGIIGAKEFAVLAVPPRDCPKTPRR